MLRDCENIRFDDSGGVRVARYAFRLTQVVESKMQRPVRRPVAFAGPGMRRLTPELDEIAERAEAGATLWKSML